jgi:hypothetical protein
LPPAALAALAAVNSEDTGHLAKTVVDDLDHVIDRVHLGTRQHNEAS